MLSDRHSLPILGAIIVCSLPHFLNVETWVIAACLLIWTYTAASIHHGWSLPKKPVRVLLTLALAAMVMLSHEGLTIEAFVALLALMISLKLLENREIRDRMLTVIFCYFLIVGSLFFDDSLIATSYMLFSVLCCTAVMIHINQADHGLLQALRLAAILMLQALPLMLIMFLIFPRIQGGLWGRSPGHTASSGFSDEISFGTVASLVTNNEVAFRVEFNGQPPPREQLYWRGIVLWQFDGTTWRRGRKRQRLLPSAMENREGIGYTLTLEPHHQHWLFSLDLPLSISLSHTWVLQDHSYYRLKSVSQRISYTGESTVGRGVIRNGAFPEDGLQLPRQGNPRARALALSWADQAGTPEEIVDMALSYFREQPFSYTLNPGILTAETGTAEDMVDRFLFDSRLGFCEHYACSFTFLMRAAGVPARVVAGYQGGNINPYGDYLVVRQADAHAWSEVWLPEKGWVRIDPTTAVAPERVQTDITNVLPAGEGGHTWSFLHSGPFGAWFNAWDLVNSRWNRWVMGYSVDDQLGFFARFGVQLDKTTKGVAKRLGVFLLIALPLLFLAGFILSRRKKERPDRLALCWLEFCRKLGDIGLTRSPGQGPKDYMHFILGCRPDLGVAVEEIVTLYISLRYGDKPDHGQERQLAAMIKAFKPQKSVRQ